MASHTIALAPWSEGTSVSVYPAAAQPDPTQAPSGTAVVTSTVAGGQVAFIGVAQDVRYVAWAAGVGVRFLVPSLLPANADRSRLNALEAQVNALRVVVTASEAGARGDGVTNDSVALQSAINSLPNGGIVQLAKGDYVVNTALTFPLNKIVRLRGVGFASSGGVFGTRLIRTSGTNPIIDAQGTGQATNQRVYPEFENLTFHGGTIAAPLVRIWRATHALLDRVRISNCGGTGLHLREVWDSHAPLLIVETCGNGTTDPAVLMDSVVGAGANANCATIQIGALILQSNLGTDLRLTGSSADGSPCNDVEIGLVKAEGTGAGTFGAPDTYPYLDFDYAQNCQVAVARISMPTGRAAVFLQQVGSSPGPRSNRFGLALFDVAGTNAPARLIDHAVGALEIARLSMPGTQPTSEYIRIQSSVSPGRFKVGGINHNSPNPASGFITDQRAVNEELSKGHVGVARISGSATAGTLGNATVFDFADAASNDFIGQVEIPRDADPNGQARLRLYWASATTGGDVHWRTTSKIYTAGDDASAAGTIYEVLSTAAGTANLLTVVTMTSGPACVPGGVMTVFLQRLGAQGDDTHTGVARLVRAEVLYDRRS